MSRTPYFDAGKGSAPRSNNSEAYLKNYDEIFRKKKPCKPKSQTLKKPTNKS